MKRLLSDRECSALYGCGQSTWWRWLKKGLVPQPIRIGRRTLWELAALEQHIAELSAQRTTK